MAYCSKCGNQLEEGTQFCPKCGNAVGTTNSSTGGNPKSENEESFLSGFKRGWNEANAEAAAQEEYDKAHPEEVKAREKKRKTKIMLIISIIVLFISMFTAFACGVGWVTFVAFTAWIASIWYTVKVFKGKFDINVAYKVSFILPALAVILFITALQSESPEHKEQVEKSIKERKKAEEEAKKYLFELPNDGSITYYVESARPHAQSSLVLKEITFYEKNGHIDFHVEATKRGGGKYVQDGSVEADEERIYQGKEYKYTKLESNEGILHFEGSYVIDKDGYLYYYTKYLTLEDKDAAEIFKSKPVGRLCRVKPRDESMNQKAETNPSDIPQERICQITDKTTLKKAINNKIWTFTQPMTIWYKFEFVGMKIKQYSAMPTDGKWTYNGESSYTIEESRFLDTGEKNIVARFKPVEDKLSTFNELKLCFTNNVIYVSENGATAELLQLNCGDYIWD